jgi:hypothetical protein
MKNIKIVQYPLYWKAFYIIFTNTTWYSVFRISTVHSFVDTQWITLLTLSNIMRNVSAVIDCTWRRYF